MMRGRLAWLVIAAACGSDKSTDPVALPATSRDLPPEAPIDAGVFALGPAAPPDPVAPVPPVACLPPSEPMVVRIDRDELQACVDTDGDGAADRCARWIAATGSLRGFSHAVDVDRPHAPIAFGENPDPRVELVDPQVEVCPPDRVCVKLMPRMIDDGDITGVGADAAYRTLAIAMRHGSSTTGHVEVWDLVAGRLRTKLALRKLEEDTEYTFDARFVGNTVLAVASRADNHHGQGVLYGADGTVRGELANGSRYLDLASVFEIAPSTLALLDLEAPGIPYAVYTQSAATGRVLRKFVVAMDMDGDDDDAHLHQVSPTVLAVTQWSTELRVDLIDLATGNRAQYRVPAC